MSSPMLPQAERSSGVAARRGIMYNYTNVLVPSRRVLVSPGEYPLRIPGQADLRLAVSHGEEQDGRGPVHSVDPRPVSHDSSDYVCEGLSMRVVPPLAPYRNMTEEPDDNTHAARAQRYAMVTLVHEGTEKVTPLRVWLLCYAFWTLWSEQEYFTLRVDGAPDRDVWVPSTLLSGLAIPHPADTAAASPPGAAGSTGTILVSRAAFWQGAGPRNAGRWLPVLDVLPDINVPPSVMTPENACADGIRRSASHPHRAPKIGPWDSLNPDACTTPIYRRYIPEFGQTLTYRLVSPHRESDVDLVHKWHASDRVSAGWRQNLSRDEHRRYLEAISKSSDQMALIGEWDGEPWGYVEVYWCLESAFSSYYQAQDYDRGCHILVGEERFRGPDRVRSWMGSLIHMVYLLDPRTNTVIAEPRASNARVVDYICSLGGHVHSLIDLPHKRAALLIVPRLRFFQLCPVGPLPSVDDYR